MSAGLCLSSAVSCQFFFLNNNSDNNNNKGRESKLKTMAREAQASQCLLSPSIVLLLLLLRACPLFPDQRWQQTRAPKRAQRPLANFEKPISIGARQLSPSESARARASQAALALLLLHLRTLFIFARSLILHLVSRRLVWPDRDWTVARLTETRKNGGQK